MTTTKQQHGFTLIEMMIVVAIIGILASISLPAYNRYFIRAKFAEILNLAPAIEKAIADYYAYTGEMAINNKMAGLPEPEQLRTKYIDSITVEKGAIHFRMKDNIGLEENNKTLSLQPGILAVYPPNATIIWLCGKSHIDNNKLLVFGENKTNIKAEYLPSSCR